MEDKYKVIKTDNGDILYLKNGKYHREDGPAVEFSSGTKHWYINGLRHREDGPAIEYLNGTREWYINGKCHREDGPAIEYSSGYKIWFINDNRINEEVNEWIISNNIPEYEEWTNKEKAIFKLKFL